MPKKKTASRRSNKLVKNAVKKKNALQTLFFKDLGGWKKWLKKNEKLSPGIWLKFKRAGAADSVLKYPEARDEAICYGWIDGQIKPIDDKHYLRRFTPRKPKSVWSKFNRELVEKLTKEKRMKASGLEQVQAAKADGRWERAYDSARTAEPPDAFLKRLEKSKKAKSYWESLSRSKRYPMIWKLNSLKTEKKREEWMEKFVQLLSKKQVFEIFPSKKKKTKKKLNTK